MESFLSVDSLDMIFSGKKADYVALANIQLAVRQGECLALIGHSGCGKSTLLSLIAGLIPATRGQISCGGDKILGPGPDRAVVFQNHNLLPWLTCLENVLLAVDSVFAKTEPPAIRRDRAMAALKLVGLAASAERFPSEISGGMKQRVGIARALSMQPRVLLLDEPFGALDALTRSSLQDELVNIIQSMQCTVVLVTHDVDEAVFLADRIALMTQGPAASIGRMVSVPLERPRDRLKLAHDPLYQEIRAEVLESLLMRDERIAHRVH